MGKAMSIAGMVAGGLVALAFIANLIIKVPFGGSGGALVNVGFFLSGAILAYLGWNAFREMR
jgi:hypothetical protein